MVSLIPNYYYPELPRISVAATMLSFLGGATASDIVDGNVSIVPSVITTTTVGIKPVTFTATDDYGNSSQCNSTVNVNYRFAGFHAPVDMPPVTNSAKAGSTIPLKWSLPDGNGGFFSDLTSGTLNVRPTTCGSFESELASETLTTAGASGLRYDALENHFVFNWKTASTQKGCFLLTLTLNDATRSTINALVKLK